MSITRSLRFRSVMAAGLVAVLAVAGCSVGSDDAADEAAVTVTQRVSASTAEQSADQQPADGESAAGQPGAAESETNSADGDAGGITVVAPPGAEDGAGEDTGAEGTAAGGAGAEGTGPATGEAATGTAAESAPAGSTASSSTAEATKTTEATKKPKPKPKPKKVTKIATSPKDTAQKVSVLEPIKVRATGGVLVWVKIVNPEGKVVAGGKVKKNARTWSWKAPKLGWNRVYTIKTLSRSSDKVLTKDESKFRTMKPAKTVRASVSPSGRTVGVAQPIIIRFTEKIDDRYRRKVEKMITITRTHAQPGAFRWFSQTEVHWRPKGFWQAKSKVKIDLDIYGAKLSPNLFGSADLSAKFNVGRRMTFEVDAKKHTMDVYQDFKLIKSIPVSLGNDKYPTYNGTHVVTDKHKTYVMDSSTWGLKGAGAYRTKVKWATRISNSGEFVHGAPWSEYAQGNTNVSHGCINMTDGNAKWFYAISLAGDPVRVKNSTGKQLDIYDGIGDWAVPFAKY